MVAATDVIDGSMAFWMFHGSRNANDHYDAVDYQLYSIFDQFNIFHVDIPL